jgi:hypothetical protein
MQRLIDANELKMCVILPRCGAKTIIGDAIRKMIDSAPTVDAEPVRHGKWIWKGEDGDSRWMCSECKCKEYVPTCNGVPNIWDYCPNCGARMDKE